MRRLRVGLIGLLALASSLALAPAALAKFGVKALHVGTASGTVDYLYTAGNTVVEQGSADRGRYYHFDVYDPSGTVRWTSACRPATSNGTVSGSYTLRGNDPLSNTTGWRFRLREFSNASSCANSNSSQRDASLYFDVAAATSYSSSALSTQQNFFKASASAYVQVSGVGEVGSGGSNSALGAGTWSESWLLPSGATACANTVNNASDLPGSTAGGQLPTGTSYLQYAPSSGAGLAPWNQLANYETQPCPAFSSGNQGQWSLLLKGDATHFVKLPVFAVETAAPHSTITSGPANATSSTAATFTFISSVQGSSFQCSLDGATPTSCTSPQSYSGLGSGAHTFSVQATDPAGNAEPTPATTSWTVFAGDPVVTLASPSAGSYTNKTGPAFSGTAQTAAGDSNVTVAIYAGAGATGSPIQSLSATVQPNGSWTVNASTLAEGAYTVQAAQTDAVNNTGYSDERLFTVDTTPPTVAASAPVNGTHTNDTMPQISGTAGTAASDVPTVTVTLTGVGSPVQLTANVSSSGTWNVGVPQTLSDGNYTVQAAQSDMAGNTGYSNTHITIDTTPPQTVVDAGPVGVTSSSTAVFSFHSTDGLSQAGSTFQCQLDGGAWGACSSPTTDDNLADGSHTFSVEAIDGAGNVDTIGQTVTWTINSALPAITLDSPADGAVTNDTTPTLSGAAGTAPGDSTSVQVLIYHSTDLSGSPVQTLSTTAGNGAWSATASTLADGTYVAYAQQSGTAGTATSTPHTFTVATQPPVTTITLGPPGDSGTGTASFSFISSAPASTFECQLDGAGWTTCASPKDYSNVGNGSHTFQVRATDQAGNVGAPASQSWSVNTSLPALSLTSPNDGTVTNDPAPAISGVAGTASGDSSTVTVNIYSGTGTAGGPLETLSASVSPADGSWTARPNPPLSDGTYTVYAQQVGSAGTAYTSPRTFTIDTVPPTTTIVSGPQGATSATNAKFAFTSSVSGSTFECQIDNGSWNSCTSPQSYTSLAVGTHAFSVRATDPAGNVDPNPPEQTWTIDTTVPVTLTTPADGTMTNNTAPTFSGTASAANGPITVEIDDAGGNPVDVMTANAAGAWSTTASPALPEGMYFAFASQLGSDGVTTDYSNVVGFTVDTTPPSVTLATAPQGTTNVRTPSFAGRAGTATGDLGTVKVKLYSGTSASGAPIQTLSATPSAGSWSAVASGLANGTYTVRAEQSDSAGNTGYSASRTFTVNATPPTTTITGGPSASTTDTTATFSFTSSAAGSTFECKLDGGDWSGCNPPRAYSSLTVGSHTFSVRATDGAGNVDPTPPTASWTITAPAGSPPPTSSTPSTTPTNPPPPPTPTAGLPKLQLRLTAKAIQHLSRHATLRVRARCSKACRLVLSGRFVVTAQAKVAGRTKPRAIVVARLLVKKLAAGKSRALTIKLPARARKAITAAIVAKQRTTLTLTGVVSAHGMKSGSARVRIRLVA
jgi:hypothetical protein